MKSFAKTKKEIEKLPENKKERAMALLAKAEFMEAELQKLEEIIETKGWVEPYQNGANQKGFKKCSEGETYIALSKNYAGIMKQLEDFIPDQQETETNAFRAFTGL